MLGPTDIGLRSNCIIWGHVDQLLAGDVMRTTTTERNREIFASFQAGKSVGELAEIYALAPTTVGALIRIEGHKLEVSIDDFYRDLRRSLGVQLQLRP